MYSEDEKTNDSESDVSNSDELECSPEKKRKVTIDNRLFKKKVLHFLRKGTDATAGEFVISGKLENAPMVIISVKVTCSPFCFNLEIAKLYCISV